MFNIITVTMQFDPLEGFQAGDNITATVTIQLNPT